MLKLVEGEAPSYARPVTAEGVSAFKIDRSASLPEVKREPPPHVTLSFPITHKFEGPLLLHPDRMPTQLEVEEKNTDGKRKISLPSGAYIWFSINDRPFLLRDTTTNSENGQGTHGVIISHDRTLQHEIRHKTYKVNGVEEHVDHYIYSMSTPNPEYLNEGDEMSLGGVEISYNTTYPEQDEIEHEQAGSGEVTLFERIAA